MITPGMSSAEKRKALRQMEVEAGKKMYAEGMNLDDIATKIGCSQEWITKRLREEGVEIRRRTGGRKPRMSPEVVDTVIKLLESGLSWKEVMPRLKGMADISFSRAQQTIQAERRRRHDNLPLKQQTRAGKPKLELELKVVDLYESGRGVRDVALEADVSGSLVLSILREYGIPTRTVGRPKVA